MMSAVRTEMRRAPGIKRPEIMAPAGDWTGLQAALDAGCDAVYFGIRGMNMRAGAKNFTPPAMKKIARLCHAHHVKAYLALNTLVYEQELRRIRTVLSTACEAGIDAVICWDFAVIREACRRGIPVHISTQMSVANSQSILFFYRQMGVRRFVLARECSLSDIRRLKKQIAGCLGAEADTIELEVFAHGAMCVSISGRCLLSQFLHGTSANRGACLQPCRRQYQVAAVPDNEQLTVGANYILSPSDLCTLPFIEKLLKAGVASLKIEGRNRSPEYVGTVVSVYRQAVDFYVQHKGRSGFERRFRQLKKELISRVQKVYNRGLSSGFYLGKPLDQWAPGPGSQAPVRKAFTGTVTKYYPRLGVAEVQVESGGFMCGDEVLFQGPKTGTHAQGIESIEVAHQKIDHARKGMLVAVKVSRRVRKHDKVFTMIAAGAGPA